MDLKVILSNTDLINYLGFNAIIQLSKTCKEFRIKKNRKTKTKSGNVKLTGLLLYLSGSQVRDFDDFKVNMSNNFLHRVDKSDPCFIRLVKWTMRDNYGMGGVLTLVTTNYLLNMYTPYQILRRGFGVTIWELMTKHRSVDSNCKGWCGFNCCEWKKGLSFIDVGEKVGIRVRWYEEPYDSDPNVVYAEIRLHQAFNSSRKMCVYGQTEDTRLSLKSNLWKYLQTGGTVGRKPAEYKREKGLLSFGVFEEIRDCNRLDYEKSVYSHYLEKFQTEKQGLNHADVIKLRAASRTKLDDNTLLM